MFPSMAIGVLVFLAGKEPAAMPNETPAQLAALVDELGSAAPLDEKRAAGRALVAAGLDAVPMLLASLDDGRVYERRDIANRMNLPNGAHVEPLMSTFTVGDQCRTLLYEIVTPTVSLPEEPRFKVFSEQILAVDDWRAFFAARRGRTLAQIHEELAPLVRAYWAAHGTTQKVKS